MRGANLLKIILLAVILSACGEKSSKPKQEIVTVTTKPFSTSLYFSGIVQPLKTMVITNPMDGVVHDMLFHYGDKVKPNQLLFAISSEKFRTEYKNMLMQYIKAKNESNTTYGQLVQSEFLHKNELISDDDLKAKKERLL